MGELDSAAKARECTSVNLFSVLMWTKRSPSLNLAD